MRIDAYNQVLQVYQSGNNMKTQKVSKPSSKDKVEISSFGKAYQVAKNAVNEAADVREEKIADIKRRLDNGTYEVSSESFAEKLLEGYNEAL